MRYAVISEQDENGFGAYVPDFPGCVAVGETKEEALRLIREAIELHLLDHKGPFWPVGVRTDGKIEVIFQWLKARQPFANEAKREELLHHLNEIAGVDVPPRLTGRPSFPLSALGDDAALKQFLEVLDWFVQEVKAT